MREKVENKIRYQIETVNYDIWTIISFGQIEKTLLKTDDLKYCIAERMPFILVIE